MGPSSNAGIPSSSSPITTPRTSKNDHIGLRSAHHTHHQQMLSDEDDSSRSSSSEYGGGEMPKRVKSEEASPRSKRRERHLKNGRRERPLSSTTGSRSGESSGGESSSEGNGSEGRSNGGGGGGYCDHSHAPQTPSKESIGSFYDLMMTSLAAIEEEGGDIAASNGKQRPTLLSSAFSPGGEISEEESTASHHEEEEDLEQLEEEQLEEQQLEEQELEEQEEEEELEEEEEEEEEELEGGGEIPVEMNRVGINGTNRMDDDDEDRDSSVVLSTVSGDVSSLGEDGSEVVIGNRRRPGTNFKDLERRFAHASSRDRDEETVQTESSLTSWAALGHPTAPIGAAAVSSRNSESASSIDIVEPHGSANSLNTGRPSDSTGTLETERPSDSTETFDTDKLNNSDLPIGKASSTASYMSTTSSLHESIILPKFEDEAVPAEASSEWSTFGSNRNIQDSSSNMSGGEASLKSTGLDDDQNWRNRNLGRYPIPLSQSGGDNEQSPAKQNSTTEDSKTQTDPNSHAPPTDDRTSEETPSVNDNSSNGKPSSGHDSLSSMGVYEESGGATEATSEYEQKISEIKRLGQGAYAQISFTSVASSSDAGKDNGGNQATRRPSVDPASSHLSSAINTNGRADNNNAEKKVRFHSSVVKVKRTPPASHPGVQWVNGASSEGEGPSRNKTLSDRINAKMAAAGYGPGRLLGGERAASSNQPRGGGESFGSGLPLIAGSADLGETMQPGAHWVTGPGTNRPSARRRIGSDGENGNDDNDGGGKMSKGESNNGTSTPGAQWIEGPGELLEEFAAETGKSLDELNPRPSRPPSVAATDQSSDYDEGEEEEMPAVNAFVHHDESEEERQAAAMRLERSWSLMRRMMETAPVVTGQVIRDEHEHDEEDTFDDGPYMDDPDNNGQKLRRFSYDDDGRGVFSNDYDGGRDYGDEDEEDGYGPPQRHHRGVGAAAAAAMAGGYMSAGSGYQRNQVYVNGYDRDSFDFDMPDAGGYKSRRRPGATLDCCWAFKMQILFVCSALFVALSIFTIISTQNSKKALVGSNDTISASDVSSPSLVPTVSPSPRPSPMPTVSSPPSSPAGVRRFDEIYPILLAFTLNKTALIEDPTSPQRITVDWLADVDGALIDPSDVLRLVQRYAVGTLYHALGGAPGDSNELGYLSDDHECYWMGVVCDCTENVFMDCEEGENGFIRALDFEGYAWKTQLGGQMPTEVGLLQYVERIDFSFFGKLEFFFDVTLRTGFTGTIPWTIGNLPRLKEFNCVGNKLSGLLPPDLGRNMALTSFKCGHNSINGKFPDELGYLANLETLNLAFNEMTGSIPATIGQLTNLKNLDLSKNFFSGDIMSSLEVMTSLEEIRLWDNLFSGTLSAELSSKLENIRIFSLAENNFNGNLPSEWGSFSPSLSLLSLGMNDLSGPFPPEIGALASLSILDLWDNALTGTLPEDSLKNMNSLTQLLLGRNFFSGLIPGALPLRLKVLSLEDNSFIADLPASLGNLVSLQHLYLSSNRLNDTLPLSLANLKVLKTLDLGHNEFIGSIPENFRGMTYLDHVGLERNNFIGDLNFWCDSNPPDVYADCSQPNPEVLCSCCRGCCNDGEDNCDLSVNAYANGYPFVQG